MAKYGTFRYGRVFKYGIRNITDNYIFDRSENDLVEDNDYAYIHNIDLNRVENNIQKDWLAVNKIGYYIPNKGGKTDWIPQGHADDASNIPTTEQMTRLMFNYTALIEGFYLLSTTPESPRSMNFINYKGLNAIEKTLYDILCVINDIDRVARQCGDCECGGE